jgi:hypothetical protein
VPLSRDAVLPAVVVGWLAVALLVDTGGSLGVQRLLGVATWLILLAALRGESHATRAQVAVVVVFATAVEYVFSHWLGVYVYRLENVPAFVPPGHGLVYLAAFAIGRSAWAHRHSRLLVGTMLVGGGLWAVWGVTLSPQPDALGLFWYACLVVFTWRGERPLLYAGAFLVVSYLEIAGTSLGTWEWQPLDPVLGVVTIGNPPSGIAGGYAWFDAAALAFAPRLLGWWESRRVPDEELTVPMAPDPGARR